MKSKAKEAFRSVKAVWKEAEDELQRTQTQLEILEEKRDSLIAQMEALYPTLLELKRQDKSLDLESIVLPARIKLSVKPNTTIGDAVESILRANKKPMSRREVFDTLKLLKVSISEINARVVLTNLVKRDAKKRFVILEDGKMWLAEKTEDNASPY